MNHDPSHAVPTLRSRSTTPYATARPAPGPDSVVREDPPSAAFTPAPDQPGDPGDGDLDGLFRYLRTIESEPTSTLARQLIEDGIELPPPETFTLESVHGKLWEVVRGLARRRTFLHHTDHLDDLELYHVLWRETLNEPAHELDDAMGPCACHIDLISDGSEDSIWLWLRFYADEATRRDWGRAFPGDPMPARIAAPFDRDRFLPGG